MSKLAAIRIRGEIGLSGENRYTMSLLKLFNKNYCVVVNNSKNYIGMLTKIKDYITWGEVNEETISLLIKNRGRLAGNRNITEEYLKEKNINLNEFVNDFVSNKKTFKDIPGLKQFFRLKPPTHGFERGGIKRPFSLGGVLGYRKDKINDLIKRML
ncbi:MAG: 50S ribosomal protein L30 [Nanoarchaeota archaeon]